MTGIRKTTLFYLCVVRYRNLKAFSKERGGKGGRMYESKKKYSQPNSVYGILTGKKSKPNEKKVKKHHH